MRIKALTTLLVVVAFSATASISILNTFNAGELSPHMDARIDFQKYSSGLRTLENFICLPYGGAQKRSGTQYIAETKSDGVARLAPFSVGVDQTYIMEIGEQYIRFYQNGVQLQTSGVPLEVATPYLAGAVFEIQIAQFADIMYLVHPDYPPQKLQRLTTAPTFSIEEVTYDWPPVLDQNLGPITITPSVTTGSVTLTASDDLFTSNHVGSVWVLKSPNDSNQVELVCGSSTVTSSVLRVEGDWNFRTVGAGFQGTIELQISLDDEATWGTFREYESKSGDLRNYDRDGTETETGVSYRMVFTSDGAGTATAYLKSEDPYISGTVDITDFVSSTVVTGVVGTALGSLDAVKTWSEGAFSEERGFPRAVEFFENRLWFGGTDYQVNTVWASKTDSYQDFQTGTFDDSSLRLSINSDNIIEWMLGRSQLFIGTLGDEWVLSGGDSQNAITPTSVLARRQTSFGSRDGIDALIASDSIMYLQRQGLKLREFEYSFESDAYKSTDSTMLAEHITRGGVIQIAEQQQPEPIIWCVRGDGQLIGLTYSKVQNVYGWHRHVTDGEFESVSVIPTTGEDRVYVIVNRDGGRYVEWFRPLDWGDDDKDAWFVDSGLDFDGGDAIDITGITIGGSGSVTVDVANAWSDGMNLECADVEGMTQINSYIYTATNSTATNVTLLIASTGELADGTAWDSYTTNGTLQRVENTFTNVSHLASETLNIFADGGAVPDETVSTNGVLITDEWYNRVIAGLPFTAKLSPMYVDVINSSEVSYGKQKNPYKVHFRVNKSGTFKYGSSLDAMYPVSVREPDLAAGAPVPFFSGDPTTKPIDSSASTAPEFWVTSEEPLPLELLSLTIFTDVQEYE